jgi:hypothetical protein
MDMTVITDYSEAVRDTRNALRYHKQPRTYTKTHLQSWGALADETYPDTNNCVNLDLRNAFVHGCLMGYEFVFVFNAPSCYDRLQADAFIAGVVHGENCWSNEHPDEDDE